MDSVSSLTAVRQARNDKTADIIYAGVNSGKPNLFIFRLIGRVFGKEGGEKIRSRKWEVRSKKSKTKKGE